MLTVTDQGFQEFEGAVKKEVFKDPHMELLRRIYVDYTIMQASNAIGWVQEPFNCVLCDKKVNPEKEKCYPYCKACNEMVWDLKDNRKDASQKSKDRLKWVTQAMIDRGALHDNRSEVN